MPRSSASRRRRSATRGASYDYAGRTYALPLDAAAQVQVLQPALVGDRPAPETWCEVLELAAGRPLALSLAGPHALLTFFSICAGLGDDALGEPLRHPRAGRARPRGARPHAAARRRARSSRCAPRTRSSCSRRWRRERAAACCPLVYGYVNYARAAGGREALRFADAPALGSTLGGTGIAVTRRCPQSPALAAPSHLAARRRHTGDLHRPHEGQPAARGAWLDAALERARGGFYSATRRTTEAAWVRPRHAGYIEFQPRASGLIRSGLAERVPPARLLDRLGALWRASLPAGAAL